MGLCLCLTVLLVGVFGYIGPFFLILAMVISLGLNASLVAMLRFQCRGGRPNRDRRDRVQGAGRPGGQAAGGALPAASDGHRNCHAALGLHTHSPAALTRTAPLISPQWWRNPHFLLAIPIRLLVGAAASTKLKEQLPAAPAPPPARPTAAAPPPPTPYLPPAGLPLLLCLQHHRLLRLAVWRQVLLLHARQRPLGHVVS